MWWLLFSSLGIPLWSSRRSGYRSPFKVGIAGSEPLADLCEKCEEKPPTPPPITDPAAKLEQGDDVFCLFAWIENGKGEIDVMY